MAVGVIVGVTVFLAFLAFTVFTIIAACIRAKRSRTPGADIAVAIFFPLFYWILRAVGVLGVEKTYEDLIMEAKKGAIVQAIVNRELTATEKLEKLSEKQFEQEFKKEYAATTRPRDNAEK